MVYVFGVFVGWVSCVFFFVLLVVGVGFVGDLWVFVVLGRLVFVCGVCFAVWVVGGVVLVVCVWCVLLSFVCGLVYLCVFGGLFCFFGSFFLWVLVGFGVCVF